MPTDSRSGRARRPADPSDIPVVPYEGLESEFIRIWGYRQGKFNPEHLSVYGPSDSGKSTLIGRLVTVRSIVRGSHVVYVQTKPDDGTVAAMGWHTTDSWPPGYGENRVVFKAPAKGISREHKVPQRARVLGLMNALWRKGSNIVVVWDEMTYAEVDLGLRTEINTFWREGRTMGITNVAGMQRPSGVTRLAHSQNRWVASFGTEDQDDRDRVAEVFGHRALYREVIADLDNTQHEFVIKDRFTGMAYRSHIPRGRAHSAARHGRVRSDQHTVAGGR